MKWTTIDRIAMWIKWHCAGRTIHLRIPALPFLWQWAIRRIDAKYP